MKRTVAVNQLPLPFTASSSTPTQPLIQQFDPAPRSNECRSKTVSKTRHTRAVPSPKRSSYANRSSTMYRIARFPRSRTELDIRYRYMVDRLGLLPHGYSRVSYNWRA